MSTFIIRGGTVVHSSSSERADVLVRDGRIIEVGTNIEGASATEIDASGCVVGPAFVDLHAHLREPGNEAAETIESGARAGAVGGYGAVVAMPNTTPTIDSAAVVGYVYERARHAVIDVAVAGAITMGREGKNLAPMAEMAALGVRLFTDDGNGVQHGGVMRRALRYSSALGVRLAQHCEMDDLAGSGVMNDGPLAARLGLAGRSALAEEIMVMRDIELVRASGGCLHFLHLSTRRSVELVSAAKAEGLDVTCEVAPHHFTLSEDRCASFDPVFKVHPPLRSTADVQGLRAAVARGDIDAVATDHAPHTPESKDGTFDDAPPGMLGLETAAALTWEAVNGDPQMFFNVLSRGPARVAQLRAGELGVRRVAHGGEVVAGEDASLVIFDPTTSWTVDRRTLQSRALNTPFHDRVLTGYVRGTIVGEPVWLNGEFR